MVDLTKCDEYEDLNIPDEHVEIALKVLRTLRNMYLCFECFDYGKAVVLSHAHSAIAEAVSDSQGR